MIAELLFGTQCLGGLFAALFGNADAVLLPPERKSERSYGSTGSGNPHRPPDGAIFPEDPPFGLGRERSANFILLRLRFRTLFPSAEGLAPRKSGGRLSAEAPDRRLIGRRDSETGFPPLNRQGFIRAAGLFRC